MRSPTLALVALAICTASSTADAFLLLGKSKKVAAPATRALVVREADKTLLAVQPRYVGPADTVALLIPVPKSAGEPTTLAPAHVDRLDGITAPRVVELWEQDPCEMQADQPVLDGDAPKPGGAPPPVEAPSAVWKKQPLEGKTGAEIVAGLEKAGFVVPEGAAAVVDGYVAAGNGFVLATFDAPESKDAGQFLPPLRVDYEAKDFALATRLAALRGGHDFTAYVLSPDGRFEATGQANQGIPTNLDVLATAKDKVSTFYGQLGDFVFAAKPEALVTEYAWSASSCEACSAPLVAADVLALGSGLLPSVKNGTQYEVLVEAQGVTAQPDGPDDLRARLGACYGKALAAKGGLGGVVTVDVKTDSSGAVTSATGKGDDAALQTCAEGALKGGKLDANDASGSVKVTFAPVGREYLASYVLTRLHARFDKAPDKDIALRRGSPLEGGRELGPDPDAPAPAKAYASDTTDNYQPRYVVRHAWAGKIECQTPKRGTWGPAPKDGAKGGDPAPSTSGSAAPSAGPAGSAKAPKKDHADKKADKKPDADKKEKADKKDGADKKDEKAPAVAAFLASGSAPDLAAFAITLPAGTAKPPAPKPAPSASAPPPPAPSASSTPAAPPADGCGCAVPESAPPRAGFAALIAAAAAVFARRARRRSAR